MLNHSINITIPVNRDEQIQIEEYCINSGQSISRYLMDLHHKFQSELAPVQVKGAKPIKWVENGTPEQIKAEEGNSSPAGPVKTAENPSQNVAEKKTEVRKKIHSK